MLGDHRTLFQLELDDIHKIWNEQAPRLLILVSLALQIILTLLGNLRKYNPRTLNRIILWCVHSLAYTVVPVALNAIGQGPREACNSSSDKSNTMEIISFWASFLLLHLGGPDTITAYSLQDNELVASIVLGMLIVLQSGFALYILLLSLPGCSHLPLLSILVYAAGCIKCLGRVQALWLGSTGHLRRAMLGPADPGPDYVKFMEEFHLKKSQGFIVKVEEIAEPPLPVINAYPESQSKEILEAYDLFKKFKRLFVDLILTYEDKDISTSYFCHLDSDGAFRAVEIELGFAYDELYTKATVVYTDKGLLLRATSIFLILLVLVGFCFLSDVGKYQVIDVFITYLLIAAEISKELFVVITMLCSDWTDLWLNQHNHTRDILRFPFLKQPTKQRWSNSIAQLDILSVSLEEKPASFLRIQKLFGVDEYQEKQRYETYNEVSANLKDMIYRQFYEFMDSNFDYKSLCFHRGSYSLQQNNCNSLLWSINDVEFDQSILIWHIATSLCYYSEVYDQFGINRTESNHLSKYLVNLLVSNPEMLPVGIGMIRYRDTCADAKRFFKSKGPSTDKAEACRKLLKVDYCNELLPSIVKGDRSKSVLFDGCRLALALREMKREHMWKVISQVWIEILAYAAAHCRGLHHSQQLGRGGEFLTHVWLLIAHLGLTEHFQVSRGHARARFNVS